MINIRSGIAAFALTVMVAAPAFAQDHRMDGPGMRGDGHGQMMMHHDRMSRADMRMMARCHRMSHRAMMRSHSCKRVMMMQERMGRHDDGGRGNMHGDHRM